MSKPFHTFTFYNSKKQQIMTYKGKKIKLVPVTDNRNTVTVIDNVTIVEVNKPKSHK